MHIKRWGLKETPRGADLWCSSAGHIIGDGSCHYHWFPDYFCPHIITSGEGIVKAAGKTFYLKAGDMFTIWAGAEIEYSERADNPWRFRWIHLAGAKAGEYTAALGFSEDNPVLKPDSPKECEKIFCEIYSLMSEHRTDNIYLLLSALYKLPAYCLPENTKTIESGLIEEAINIIEASRFSMNVNELCEMLQVSRTTLFRVFRKKLRKTPIEYIMEKRILIAKKLLTETGHSISKVALLSGFSSEKYFIRRFKMAEGVSPGNFRMNCN